MAKYQQKRIDLRDVVAVSRIYNELWRQYTHFPESGRKSDYELWSLNRPSMRQTATVGDGFAKIEFTFRNTSEADAQKWVEEYVDHHKVPYTFFRVRPSRDLKGYITYEPGEEIPKYVRVEIRFEDDEVAEERKRKGA
ncbi:MAG: hypothetical protein ACXADH_05690 [Candidatus Kariarchaeaceae archaeon]|jgi:hypothetical protein